MNNSLQHNSQKYYSSKLNWYTVSHLHAPDHDNVCKCDIVLTGHIGTLNTYQDYAVKCITDIFLLSVFNNSI